MADEENERRRQRTVIVNKNDFLISDGLDLSDQMTTNHMAAFHCTPIDE